MSGKDEIFPPYELSNQVDILRSQKQKRFRLLLAKKIKASWLALPEQALKPSDTTRAILSDKDLAYIENTITYEGYIPLKPDKKPAEAQEKAVAKGLKEPEPEPSEGELDILRSADLLMTIGEEFDKKIVGEKESRMAIFLNACGKWVINHNIASYNLCINSNSGAGKDFVCKNVIKILPSDQAIIRSRISPAAFTYWHNSKFEPDWTWDNKVLLLSDVSNNVLNSEVFKLMASDGTYSTIVRDQMAVDIEIKGKPVLFITTASANPNNEILRRLPMLELDESQDQTKSIMERQALFAMKGISTDYEPLITSCLGKLKRVSVSVPFAQVLTEHFPHAHIIMRTHFQRLIDYIKASAALHQYQRERDEGGFVIATPEDYDNAIIPLKATTSNPMMIPLTKKQKMLLAKCKELVHFSVKEIEPRVPFYVRSKLYDALTKLQDLGFLTSEYEDLDESKKAVKFYTYIEFIIPDIPSWQQIQDNCRKKGIEGEQGNKGIQGNEGNDDGFAAGNKNNSLNSLNSPLKLTNEKKCNVVKMMQNESILDKNWDDVNVQEENVQ